MEWKKINGFEKYSVSDTGLVRNDDTGKMLKPDVIRGGYLRLTLCKDGKRTRKMVHRIVAEMYIPNPLRKREVNHINGDKADNRKENLEWVTRSENELHATHVLNTAARSLYAKSKPILCVETGVVYESYMEAERQVGAYHGNICRCLRGERETVNGYHWKYADK